MFLDILEFTVENKDKNLVKTVLKMWSQINKKNGLGVPKTIFRDKKRKKKNNENVYNIWRILGRKLVLLKVRILQILFFK